MAARSETALPSSAAEVRDADLGYLADVLDEEFRRLSGRRLLITGGAGFLGYYLVQAPLAWNDQKRGEPINVTVYDNYFRGVPEWLAGLTPRADLELVEHDMRLPLPADMGHFDAIIHAAGIASPTYYRMHPIETMDANINGLRSLLDYAVAEAETGRPLVGFLFFSSSEIYGDPTPDAIPTPETYRGLVSCTGPRACYDESKRYGETLCVNFAQTQGVPVTIARPFNNYGPGMKITDGRVIADFNRAVVEGNDIVMFSDGSPSRTFCYSADAVAGYYRVLMRGGPGEPYNIGADGPEISMAQLADALATLGTQEFGYPGRVVLGQSPEADYLVDNPNRRCPDISKARSELDYEPHFGLEEGLRRTLVWYRENRGGEEQ
jgi:dTDP-glucose 4,6-dehydratase/UDP-glucuronate decarboxylase